MASKVVKNNNQRQADSGAMSVTDSDQNDAPIDLNNLEFSSKNSDSVSISDLDKEEVLDPVAFQKKQKAAQAAPRKTSEHYNSNYMTRRGTFKWLDEGYQTLDTDKLLQTISDYHPRRKNKDGKMELIPIMAEAGMLDWR